MPPCSTAGSGRAGRDPVRHPLFARCYARFSVAAETRLGMAGLRERLLAGLTGRVIEIGAGNGLNFAHYPGGVAEVVAIEPERLLRHKAVAAALRADVPVDVVPGRAEALPVKSEAFDAVVFSLVLCSVHDVSRALAEARRVLRPGGEVRFFEHGVGGGRVMGLAQRALDRTVWPPLSGGCHLSRDPVAALRAAGFVLGPYRRVLLPQTGPVLPSSYCSLGTAWRPAADGRRNPGDGPGPEPRSRAGGEPGAGGQSGTGGEPGPGRRPGAGGEPGAGGRSGAGP